MRRLITLVAVAVMVGGACSGGADRISVQARFTDVGDLAQMAPVHFADIRVGEVTGIELSGTQALVTMEVRRDANVPANVIARIRRTSVLGERIVDLVLAEGASAASAPLQDGATISDTEVRPDLEELVVEGSEVFGVISASEIATMVDEGAKGFGGRGEKLGRILVNLRDITKAYSGRTADIRQLVASLDRFNSTLASQSDSHRRAVQNTARAIEALAEESDRLEAALKSLARLARGGRSILDAHVDEMDRFFDQMHVITAALAEEQGSIANLLKWAPRHNRNTQLVEYDEFNQIIQEFVICGLTDNPKDPARRCKGEH